MQLTVCVETVFTDRDIVGRLEAIGRHGLNHFELWGLNSHDLGKLKSCIHEHGYQLTVHSGNRNNSLINPDERSGFLEELDANLLRAQALNCPAVMLLTDALDSQGTVVPPSRPLLDRDKLISVEEGLSQAVAQAERAGVTLLLEPLNTKVDHPGYFMAHSATGLELIRGLNSSRIKLLYDIYHMQLMEGDLIRTIEANLTWIGHIHVADVPGRHEPGTGEINYRSIARMLAHNEYQGCVGLECIPAHDSNQAIQAFTDVFG